MNKLMALASVLMITAPSARAEEGALHKNAFAAKTPPFRYFAGVSIGQTWLQYDMVYKDSFFYDTHGLFESDFKHTEALNAHSSYLGVQAGALVGNNLRITLEYSYMNDPLSASDLNFSYTSVDTENSKITHYYTSQLHTKYLKSQSLLMHMDFLPSIDAQRKIRPFAGLILGYEETQYRGDYLYSDSTSPLFKSVINGESTFTPAEVIEHIEKPIASKDKNFIYGVEAGFILTINNHTFADIGYKYMKNHTEQKFDVSSPDPEKQRTVKLSEKYTGVLNLSLNYIF